MTFATKSLEVGRRAANILELDLDRCENIYGSSPCTADLALQNFMLQSGDISNASWDKLNLTVTANQIANPINGTVDMDAVFETTTANLHRLQQTFATKDPTKIHALSMFVKGIQRKELQLLVFNNSSTANSIRLVFNLESQTVRDFDENGDASLLAYSIKPTTEDGVYKISMAGIADALGGATDGLLVQVRFGDDAGSFTYAGDVTKGFYVWGAQLREGIASGVYAATTTVAVDGMGTVDDACYNAFGNCQDTANFVKEVQTYKFIDRLNLPTAACDYFPAVKSVSYGSTRLDPGGGLAIRGKVTVTLQDFTTNDAKLDDYTRERTYNPEEQGTFFGKLVARNKFYIGRPMRVLEGYIDEPFDTANFRTREYIIENIIGPDKTGKVSIIGKDPLTLAANDKAKCPVPSTGVCNAAVTDTATSFAVDSGSGSGYTIDEHVRVDDEIMLVTNIATDTLTVTRAQGGTTAAAHDAGAAVQICKTYTDEPVIDIIQDLLENFAGVPSSFIPFTDWQAEETESLSGYDLTTIISEPTGVQKLLKEIVEITLLDIWYSDVDQEIKLKLQTPFTSVTQEINDTYNIVEKSLQIKAENKKRLTRVLIYYGINNYAKDLGETSNYSLANFEIEADKEGANKFNDIKTKVLFSRWMDSSNDIQIALTSQRLLKRYSNMPLEVSFTLDAKDVSTLQTGDVFDLNTRIIQGLAGLPETARFQVIETKPLKPSSQFRYTAFAFFEDATADSVTVTTDETDFNLFVELGGPPGPVDVTVTLNSGIDMRGTNGNPAFTTEGMHPDSTVTFVNNGHVYGYGGNGGNGGNANNFVEFEGTCYYFGQGLAGKPGQDGGDAIDCTIASITIDNTNGEIFAGAGGGGGGRGFASSFSSEADGGGGGGGGIGTDTGNGGIGGVGTVEGKTYVCGPVSETTGDDGVDGSESAAGAGGSGFAYNGGSGGADWGDDGNSGGGTTGGAGGAGGFAVRLNGATITWLGGNDAASVKGDVA